MSSMEDVERMIDLGREMHAESVFASMPYLEDKLRAFGRYYIDNPKAGVGVVAEDDNGVAAMMAMSVHERYFNDERYAYDMLLYVRKDKRGGLAAARVLKDVEKWAKEQSIKEVMVGIFAGISNDTAQRFYSAMGYEPAGIVMRKEV